MDPACVAILGQRSTLPCGPVPPLGGGGAPAIIAPPASPMATGMGAIMASRRRAAAAAVGVYPLATALGVFDF